MSELKGYQANADVMFEFFTRCGKEGLGTFDPAIMTKEEFIRRRTLILENLVKELKAIRLNETDIKRIVKTKKVLEIKRKDNK